MAKTNNTTRPGGIYQEGPLDAIPRLTQQAIASLLVLKTQFDGGERLLTDSVISDSIWSVISQLDLVMASVDKLSAPGVKPVILTLNKRPTHEE